MNKRPHPGGMGLPAKPYTPSAPGPAPPLPSGPPPAQQAGGYSQDQQAAHAAAWAAYYQSQGTNAGAAYSASSAQQPAAASGGANPYANYGYGAGAPHAAQAQGSQPAAAGYQQQQQQGYAAGQGYRPPPAAASGASGYQSPMQQYGQQGYTPQAQYGQQGYNGAAAGGWSGSPPPPGGQGAGYGSPQQPQQAGYTPQTNQPYFPQPQAAGFTGNQNYRPSPPPATQNRPYQPQPGPSPRQSSMQNRPPPGPGGPGGGFPPAKRPRFDGPGGGGGGGPGPSGMPPRPSMGRPPQSYGTGLARPMGNASERGGAVGRGGGPMNNIPRIGFNSAPRGGGPMRGGMGGRGGGPMMGGRGGGMMGGQRGPRDRERDMRRGGDMARPERRRGAPEPLPQRDTQQQRKRKDKMEKEAKTTMTDFRIVGIEVKELAWSWGLVGGHVFEEEKKEGDDAKGDDEEAKNGSEDKPSTESKAAEAKTETEAEPKEPEVKTEDAETKESEVTETKESEVKPEDAETKPHDDPATEAVDEKRGEKRKAKPSSVDGDAVQSPKKRTSSFVHPSKTEAGPPTSSPESNQNRFRIYFESPPELDRVPKAARRNPNKRWRRESSSVAPSRFGEGQEGEHEGGNEEHVEGDVESSAPAPAAEEPSEAKADTAAEPAVPATVEAAPGEATEAAAEAKPDPATAETDADKPADEGNSESTIQGDDVADVSMASISAADRAEASAAPAETATAKTPAGEDKPAADGEAKDTSGLTGTEESAAALEAALAQSAQNAASAYGSRNQKPRGRRWSSSSLESQADESVFGGTDTTHAHPSVNRVSVLYQESSRRLVFDASVVRKIRIFRGEGRIEVEVQPELPATEKAEETTEETADKAAEASLELPKGVLVETYDSGEQRFVAVTRERLDQLWQDDSDTTLPPLQRAFAAAAAGATPITLTVYLNKKKPLSEPKWCRTNQADEWLFEQFGRRGATDAGWRGKLEIMDPDAPPTLATILEAWKSASSSGTATDRSDFTASLLASPNDLLEILLRLTRGERNPTASIGTGPSSANGPLATAIRSDSPYASHQTHVSLAILAMYRLTTDFAEQAGVRTEVLNEKIADIIKSLPTHMIHKSLDGLYKEWLAERAERRA